MPNRGYTEEENTCLKGLVRRNGQKPGGWEKTTRAFNRKFGSPTRTRGALQTEFGKLRRISGAGQSPHNRNGTWPRIKAWGDRLVMRTMKLHSEAAALRQENHKLRLEVKSRSKRAEAAEAAYRRIEQAIDATKRRVAKAKARK